MKTIQIQEGISVLVDKIEAVYKKDNTSCTVYVGTRAYECTYPYEIFLQMLNSEKIISQDLTKDQRVEQTLEKLDAVLEKNQFFAG